MTAEKAEKTVPADEWWWWRWVGVGGGGGGGGGGLGVGGVGGGGGGAQLVLETHLLLAGWQKIWSGGR